MALSILNSFGTDVLLAIVDASGPATQCNYEPYDQQNALKSGSGLQVGATRIYTCTGDYKWSDGTKGDKQVACQSDGGWTGIQGSCNRMPLIFHSFYRENFRFFYIIFSEKIQILIDSEIK